MSQRRGVAEREKEGSRLGTVVDSAANQIPRDGETLPFVDQDRWIARDETLRLGSDDGERTGGIEVVARPSAFDSRPRLPDAFGAVDRDRCDATHESVERRRARDAGKRSLFSVPLSVACLRLATIRRASRSYAGHENTISQASGT